MSKRRTLDAIENEGIDQQLRAGDLQEEVNLHRERITKLEDVVKSLRAQLTDLTSDGVEMAIIASERAADESKRSMEEARGERDRLLKENEEMSEKVAGSYEQKKRSQQQLETLMLSASGAVRGDLQAGIDALERDRNQLGFADALLKEAREKLKAINI